MRLREAVHIVTECTDGCPGPWRCEDHAEDVFVWEHKVRCRCGAFVGGIDRLADRIDGDDMPHDMLWEVRPALRVRIRPDLRRFDAPPDEELRGTRRGGRRRRGRPRGVQWECWRGCRLPSMSLRDIARVAEDEYQCGRDVIHVG